MNVIHPNLTPAVTDQLLTADQAGGGIQDQRITQVAEQFESVFMSLLSKQLRESLEDGLFAGESSDTFGAMFDMYMGQHLAEAGGVGIKKMLINRYVDASVAMENDTMVAKSNS